MLTRLYCDNYKCLVNFEFRPSAVQLLIGRNGTGKTTIFEVLRLLRDFAARGESCNDRLAGETRTRWQEVEPQTFELEVEGKHGTYLYTLVVVEWGTNSQPRVRRESVKLNGKSLFLFENATIHLYNDDHVDKVQFPFDFKKSGLAIVESRPDNKKLMWFKEWLSKILFLQIDPKRMNSRAEKESALPSFDLSNFADWYRHLRLDQGKAMDDLRISLKEIFPGFESLDLREAGLNTRMLQVATRIEGKVSSFSFDELSDGQRALIGLYTVLHCATGSFSLMCIDEPENYVALVELQPWLGLITDLEIEDVQVFIASHHPEFLNQLAMDHGLVLRRFDGRHSQLSPFDAQGQTSLTPSEIFARGWEFV